MLDDAFARRLTGLRAEIDERLAVLLPVRTAPNALAEAVSYALLSPGKRLRPTLSLLAAEHFGPGADGAARRAALDAGCAIEMVHAASLILDDLPCMDDADLRRGRATTHRRYGEDLAVLSAVALMNQAFATLASLDAVPAAARLSLTAKLTEAIGFNGLVAGQARDLRERTLAEPAQVDELNHQKTGVLFVAAVEAGALASGASAGRLGAARAFAGALGEAFQILDDLLDATGTRASAGKDVRQDGAKATVVSLVGADAARSRMRGRLDNALDHLADVGPGPLSRFAEALFGAAPAAA